MYELFYHPSSLVSHVPMCTLFCPTMIKSFVLRKDEYDLAI